MRVPIVCALLFSSAANAGPIGSTFFCREEFAGGLAYNERTEKWQGAVFSSRTNFIVHMEEAGTTASGKFAIEARRLTVTKEGQNTAVRCLDLSQEVTDVDRVPVQNNIARCVANLSEYQFNLVNNRFLRVYAYGYVNGANNTDDTPVITGGVCTKIK